MHDRPDLTDPTYPAKRNAVPRRSPRNDRALSETYPCAAAPAQETCSISDEVARLRFALRMVLDVDVFDGAGRSVTVERMLRGYVATAVRVALEGKPVE